MTKSKSDVPQSSRSALTSQVARQINKEKAVAKLRSCIASLRSLHVAKTDDPLFQKWRRDTEIAVEYVFGTATRHISDFKSVRFTPGAFNALNPEPAFSQAFARGRASAEALLQSMIDEITEYWSDLAADGADQGKDEAISRRVFVVHGHDIAARETVARLLEKLALDPVILHEQPNKGRTIIEKFEDYTDVGFAVIILTGDDVGGKDSGTSSPTLKPRARQNVVFELGFFIGRLGRHRVCALYEEGVEIPSDYDGVLFVPLDQPGAWKFLLGRELDAAGIQVNMNLIA